jgi:hypothetical protein
MLTKRRINFFVSYARENKTLASELMILLKEQLAPSKKYDYHVWNDQCILTGELWESEIQKALSDCDFGIFLISPKFLTSKYIKEKELPTFIGSGSKPFFPVMLQPVDLDRHDLLGIKANQIFLLDNDSFDQPRSFYECKPLRRNEFVRKLYENIEIRMDEN